MINAKAADAVTLSCDVKDTVRLVNSVVFHIPTPEAGREAMLIRDAVEVDDWHTGEVVDADGYSTKRRGACGVLSSITRSRKGPFTLGGGDTWFHLVPLHGGAHA